MVAWVLRAGRLMGFWLCLLMVAVMLLVGSSIWFRHQLRAGEDRLDALHAREEALRMGMDRLAAEWSHLNQPERLSRLARAHLDLQPAPVTPLPLLPDVLAPGPVPARFER